MNCCVLSGCLDNYLPLARLTIEHNKADYCRLYGYDLKLCRGVAPKYHNSHSHNGGFSWTRLEQMRDLVGSGKYEWVYCVGCDTLITNFAIGLEDLIASVPYPGIPRLAMNLPPGVPGVILKDWKSPGYHPDGRTHVIFSADRASVVQADSFFVRGSEIGFAYLSDILSTYPVFATAPWVEQQAMADLRFKHAAIISIVPQCTMNSYDYPLYYGYGPYYYEGLDCYGKRGQWQLGDFLIHWPATPLKQRLELARQYGAEVIR